MRVRRGTAALMMAAALVASAPALAHGATGTSTQPSVVGLTTSGGAKVLSETWLDARTVDLSMSAPMVWAAPLPVRVVLPVGYSATSGKTYPVVWLLHGGNDNYTSWTRNIDIEGLTANYDAIVVMPDGGTQATYTNYLHPYNSNKLQWMQFHLTEIPQVLQQGYHANGTGASPASPRAATARSRTPRRTRTQLEPEGPTDLGGQPARHRPVPLQRHHRFPEHGHR